MLNFTYEAKNAKTGQKVKAHVQADNEQAAAKLIREQLPKSVGDSASAARWLYEQQGFTIEESADHIPWLFFKHVRQIELYSVHLFKARAGTASARLSS